MKLTFGKRPLIVRQACLEESAARTLARNINERLSDREARIFPRDVRAGGTAVRVWVLVVRER